MLGPLEVTSEGAPLELGGPKQRALLALLLFHAGMIYRAIGERAKAADYLRRALAINSKFHVLYSKVAESTLTGLERDPGGREQASNAP